MAWVGRFDDFADLGYYQASSKPGDQKRQAYGRHNAVHNQQDEFSLLLQDDGKTPIANITTNMQNVSVVGVVIAREGPRVIVSKKGSGQEKHLLCLTLRDGPTSFVNLTCWGSEQYANFLHPLTALGEVVEVKAARVQDKSNPSDERFKPWTPCPCQLSVSETNGCVSPYAGNIPIEMFASLLHMPTRDSNDVCSLDDITTNGINLQGQHVNILAMVKKVWPVRQINTKTGKKTSKVDVVLCDHSCLAFNLTLWDSFVELAERWQPMETVLFASDVKIVYNDYKSTMAASSDSKSIFTSDPDIPEAHQLLEMTRTHNTFVMDDRLGDSGMMKAGDDADPDINTITNILTAQEAKCLMTEVSAAFDGKAAYGILHCFVSHLDLDGEEMSCVRHVCPKCHKTVQESAGYVCANSNCAGTDDPFEKRLEFNLTVSFSDHTGTLDHCHLRPHVAERLLGCKAIEFSNMAVPQKTSMKWMYLLEKSKAVIKIRKGSNKGSKAFVTVLDLEPVTRQAY